MEFTLATTSALIAIALYAIAAVLLMQRFFHRQGPNRPLTLGLGGAGVLCHGLFLILVILSGSGQNMSITNVLSLVACIITLSMVISASLLPNLILLPVVFGFALLSVLASLAIPAQHIMHIEMQPGLVIHISLSLFAYGTLCIAFLYALQMSYITYRLKHKGAALLHSSLPPLMLVEGILFKLITVGTGLLVTALISGFIFLDNMFSQTYAHKTVLSLIALLIYTLLLVGQRVWGWRAKQVVGLTITGVVLLTLAYFGSRFVREVLL